MYSVINNRESFIMNTNPEQLLFTTPKWCVLYIFIYYYQYVYHIFNLF